MKAMSAIVPLLLATTVACSLAIESPTSDGPVATLDAPVFRIPFMRRLPEIDGTWSEGEWEDASALSGFWCANVPKQPYPGYQHLAPHQIQSRVYAGYDKEHIYLAYVVNSHPPKAWLKARGRFPDVYQHPLYGLMGDDHIEFELRPYHDLPTAYKYGMYKWFVNPIGVMSDQHWSLRGGLGKRWQSQAVVRADVSDTYWAVEMKMPFADLKQGDYAGRDKEGREIVQLPPPDGTTYRCWFKNGIGGFSPYVVLWDRHVWNTTKAQLVLDSSAVGFQINELGPVMEDIIDLRLTLKNHNTRSETVRLGFFMENVDGLIYSSYEDESTRDGLIELAPGAVQRLHLRKKFPGISRQDNFLWFDIRTAGRPAKIIYQNRLAKFHSLDPGPPYDMWRSYKLGSIETMRPPKKDFSFRYQYSPYDQRLSGFVDVGIHGASEEAKRATEAKLTIVEATEGEAAVAEQVAPFRGDFAVFLVDLPDIRKGEYKVDLLLFDKDKRIVGESSHPPFTVTTFPWERNELGLGDIVWEPFEPIRFESSRLETVRQSITVGASGLPQQIAIKPHRRELPLEMRDQPDRMPASELLRIGRGPQLRAPVRLEAVSAGKRETAEVLQPAQIVRQWNSELELESSLRVGPIDAQLRTRYDCDGSMTVSLTYGADTPQKVELLEMVMDIAGPVDICTGGDYSGMEPSSGLEMILPNEPGIVWDSARDEDMEPYSLYYSRFVPFIYFGSGDRGWTWICDTDEPWLIDKTGSTMTLERDDDGQLTWRIKFVNHETTVEGNRTIEFVVFTHPVKAKPADHRRAQWLDWPPANYGGENLECLPNDGPWGIAGSDATFEYFTKMYPQGAPRLYIFGWRNSGIPELQKRAYTGVWTFNQSARVDATPIDRIGGYKQPWNRPGKGQVTINKGSRSWEDYVVYQCERMVRIGKVPGWWWDGYAPPVRTECVANGQAYWRDPAEVSTNELPWQSNFGSLKMRRMYKRLARVLKENDIPNYNSFWATGATAWESYGRDSELVESAAAFAKTYEIDNITRFPITMFRYACSTSKGLYARLSPMSTTFKGFGLMPGDDMRIDRSFLGRSLLHDIGLTPSMNNAEQFAHVLNILDDFGYFEEEDTEMIPYWRSGNVCRYGPVFSGDAFETTTEDPYGQVYVTVYRRPFKEARGRKGYKAMFVILNESDEPLRGRLHILDSRALFGGVNNQLVEDIYGNLEPPHGLSLGRVYAWGREKALKDLERDGAVTQGRKDARKLVVRDEIYGPIHLLPHDYHIVYGHYDPEVPDSPAELEEYQKRKAAEGRRRILERREADGWPAPWEVLRSGPWWDAWRRLPAEKRKTESP